MMNVDLNLNQGRIYISDNMESRDTDILFQNKIYRTNRETVEWSQIYTRDPRSPLLPPVMASSAMGLNLRVFRFRKTNATCATQCFTRVCLHAQTTVHAGNTRTWQTTIILITENPKDPQFEPHARIKMAQVLGSLVYICGNDRHEDIYFQCLGDKNDSSLFQDRRIFIIFTCHIDGKKIRNL